jgi:hypothetical protein
MASVNLDASQFAVVALQAGTPEALMSVMDKWLDEHFGTEVLSVEMQVIPNGTITVMVLVKRDRGARRQT